MSFPRGAATMLAAQVLANLSFLAAVLILARTLGPEARGTMAFVIISAMLVARIVQAGVADATTVRAAGAGAGPLRPALLTNLVAWALVSGLAGAVLIVALTLAVPAIRPHGLTDGALLAIGIGTVGCALCEAGYAFIAGVSRWRANAVVLVVNAGVYVTALAVYEVVVGLDLTSAALIWGGNQVSTGLVLTFVSRSGVGFGRGSVALLLATMRYGVRAWVGTLASFANFRADQWLMGIISTELALGIYAVAVNASEVLLYLPTAVGATLTPAIAAAAPGVRGSTTLRTFRTVQAVSIASIAVAVPCAPLIPVVFGEGFREASQAFLLLLPGTIGFAAISVCKASLLASGRPGGSSVGISVALVVGFALDVVLIPRFGANGAAAAATTAFLVGGGVAVGVYHRAHPFPLRELVPRPADLRAVVAAVRRRAVAG